MFKCTYKTANLALAAFLVMEGHQLKGVDGPDQKLTFRFDPHDDLEELEFRFINRQAAVEPVAFVGQKGLHCQRGEAGLAYGQGAGEAIHDRIAPTRGDPGAQSNRH